MMNQTSQFPALSLAAVAMVAMFNAPCSTIYAQDTAFTYQGRLSEGANPASGIYDLRFAIYDASTNGNAVSGPLTNAATVVTNGLFTVALDFGASVFTGPPRWLDISVKTIGASGFTTLTPRQPVTPVPYAITAKGVSNLLGTIATVQLTGAVGNNQLANSTVTVNAGTGLGGGGAVALGGSTTLNNVGVLSVSGNADITVATMNGAVTLGDTATDANTGSTLVKRDASGNFSAGNVTLSGGLNLPATTAGAGLINSGGTRLLHAYGSENSFVGPSAGNLTMSGGNNTASGADAFSSNTNGAYNVANGSSALFLNRSGSDNVANGLAALYANTNGSDNVAGGFDALRRNTTGCNNTANGSMTLYSNLSGHDNTAHGYQALYANTTGSNNTANGTEALSQNTGGSQNIALGDYAGVNLTTGNHNIDIGSPGAAGESGTIRIGNPGIQSNTFVAGISGTLVSGGAPVYVNSSGQLGTSASAGGVALLNANQSFSGQNTFLDLVQIQTNVFMNDQDIFMRTDRNHGLGWYGATKLFSGVNLDGPVLYGWSGGGLGSASGGERLALQWNSAGNVSIDPGDLNTNGLLPGLTFGVGSGEGISSRRTLGGNEYGLDFYTGFQPRLSIDRQGNVVIGQSNANIGLDLFGGATVHHFDGHYATLNGYGLQAYDGTSSPSQLLLNNAGGETHIGGVLQVVWPDGVVVSAIQSTNHYGYRLYVNGAAYSTGGWTSSDARLKKNVRPIRQATEILEQLQGVRYEWRREEFPDRELDSGSQLGFLAQDVEKVLPEVVRTDCVGYKAIAYEKLTALLTEGAKEQQKEIKAQRKEIENLKARTVALEQNLAELRALVEQLLAK